VPHANSAHHGVGKPPSVVSAAPIASSYSSSSTGLKLPLPTRGMCVNGSRPSSPCLNPDNEPARSDEGRVSSTNSKISSPAWTHRHQPEMSANPDVAGGSVRSSNGGQADDKRLKLGQEFDPRNNALK
jgi:hypothetical protein